MTPPTPDPVERIADVVVEHVPGERELAEAIARDVARTVAAIKAEALTAAADDLGTTDHRGVPNETVVRVGRWLRNRAGALSGDLGAGLAGRREEGVRAGEGNLASLRGQSGSMDDGSNDEGDDHE